MAKSAFEKLSRKMEEEESGNVDITIVVNADADAVEEALDQEVIDTEVAAGEEIADAEETAQDVAAEMSAIAAVLREHGLNEGMRALLLASNICANYGISVPGKEGMDASGRNTGLAESLARGFEAKEDTFWEGTKKFFANMWDRIIRMYNWVVTKLGSVRGRCERARDSLKGKLFDSEKAKDAKTNDITTSELGTISDAQKKMPDLLRSTVTSLTAAAGSVNKTLSIKISEDVLKAATGFKYDGEEKLSEVDKDFMKTAETAITEGSISEYETTRWTSVNSVLEAMAQTKTLEAAAKDAKATFDKMKDISKASKDNKEETSGSKKATATNRNAMSFLLKVSGKFTKSMAAVCHLYIKNCASVRACCKAGS